MPFFSIITPVYNGADFIVQYVRVLKSQSFSDWEAIIVDDGSTDSSLELLNACIDQDPRFRIYSREEISVKIVNGPYLARNIALDHACGDYLLFLDIDDVWQSSKLSSYQAYLSVRKVDFLVSGYTCSEYFPLKDNYFFRHPFFVFDSLYFTLLFCNPVPMLTACVRRNLVGSHRFLPINHEDFVFWHQLVSSRPDMVVQILSDYSLSIYRLRPSSLSGNKIRSAIWMYRCYRHLGSSTFSSCLRITFWALYQVGIQSFPRIRAFFG